MFINPPLELGWKNLLKDEFTKPYFGNLVEFLLNEATAKKVIYPPMQDVFSAFQATSLDTLRVVIVGQDPYHGEGQAHGLCFSVKDGVPLPPSLQNIYKEIHSDLGLPIPKTGNLMPWAKQGVLLINAVMTVQKDSPGSHVGKGWETFTTAVLQKLNETKEGLVFLLWGKYAQEKGSVIDRSKHTVFEAPHPSPFSVHKGFFGCKHFSKTNEAMEQRGLQPINWSL